MSGDLGDVGWAEHSEAQPTNWWRKLTFMGPGALVAVGYIDPGNWATDIAGGSYAGYALLSIVLFSSMIAMLLQIMSARLGIATGKDLAQLSREAWPRFAWPAWIVTELTIIATDLAEVLGSAIALKLLFSIPIAIGVILTAFDVLLILAFDRRGSRMLERVVVTFLFIIACGLIYELALAGPIMGDVLRGFVPNTRVVFDPKLLYLAIGIIGATVMPHNLYLHSHLVVRRWSGVNKHKSVSLATLDTIISLGITMLLNAALVILAASVFHYAGRLDVADIIDAHHLLMPLLGTSSAAIVFAIMLLAAGQSATITGTLAGQIVMTGFVSLNMKLWIRRLITRAIALIPALIVIIYTGEQGITTLIVSSQVFLSLQLPFAMLSLLFLTSNAKYMGALINTRSMHYVGWVCALLIMLANVVLIVEIIR
jgi:manganese transport protein